MSSVSDIDEFEMSLENLGRDGQMALWHLLMRN